MFERTLHIHFKWWHEGDRNRTKSIDKDHQEALTEDALDRIFDMLKEDYWGGELHSSVRMHDSDPEDGVFYDGWWDVDFENTHELPDNLEG